jgi:aspartate/methionine/tyrosine aminotransferase
MWRMKVEPFVMERMQSEWENRVQHNLSESGVHPMTVRELLEPGEHEALLDQRLVYTQSNGTEELRTLIAALYPGAGPQNVVATVGTAEANFISMWRLLDPGDEAILMLPNYMQIWGIVRGLGATVVPFHLREEDDWRPDLDELEKALSPRTRLIAVCNPNNPTGAILSAAEMDRIAELAGRQGAWIVADEVYRGAERDGTETPSFWGRYDRVLATCGLSKAYGLPGLRIGWVVGPTDTIAELWARKDYLTISPSSLCEMLALKALSANVRPRILERTRGILKANYGVLESWVARHAGALRLVPPRAGAIAYLRYAWSVGSTDLIVRLRDEQSVLIVPGDHFGMDGFIRIGIGNEPEDLAAGLAGIDKVIDSLPAGSLP